MANKKATHMSALLAQTIHKTYLDWAQDQHPSLDLSKLTPEELAVLETAIPEALDFLQGEFTQRIDRLLLRFEDVDLTRGRNDLEAQKLLNESDLEEFIAKLYEQLEDSITIEDDDNVEKAMVLDVLLAIVESEISMQLVELRATAAELRHQEPRQRLRAL